MAKVHLIGNAHIDPVWLWRWQDGFSEVLATFRSALDRLAEFPDITFSSGCAVYYQWVEQVDPVMFGQIQQMVKAGRWELVGGWYLQPDCNIPDGESFIRHALISQRYFKEKFGVTAKTGYNVDSFGHNAGLPKILKASGMENYVFMRPSLEEQGREETVFLWESDDGSQVCAFRIPERYCIDLLSLDTLDRIRSAAHREKLPYMAFYGVGNHGGGPTIRLIHEIEKRKTAETVYSTPNRYFDTLDKTDLPVIRGELQHHARGCYSAASFVKSGNRRCEQNLLAAERLSVIAKELAGVAYPAKELEKAWENLLFNQFHDILGGCSIREAYTDAGYLFGETMRITEQIINTAMQRITWNIDTLQGESLPSYKSECHDKAQWIIWEHEVLGTPIVVFNTHPWPVSQCVQVYAQASKMTDDTANEIPFQLVRGSQTNGDDKFHTAFLAEVPALGYRVYRLFTEKEGCTEHAVTLKATETSLENDRIRIELDPVTGDICRFYRKDTGKTIIESACGAVLTDETDCDTWAHGKATLGKTIAKFSASAFSVTECGNVRASVRVTSHCGNSTLQRTYSVVSGSFEVRVQVKADFREQHKALKLTFPMTRQEVVAKTAFGTVTRTGYTGEEPCGSWIANGSLCIANDSKYGYDTEDGQLRLTVLRGAIYADHYGIRDDFCEFMDQGIHEFTYSLFPHESNSHSERRAAELNFGLRTVSGSFHKGYLPERISCFSTECDSVIFSAIKESTDDDRVILRFYEADGRDTPLKFRLLEKEVETQVSRYGLQTLDDSGNRCNAMEWSVSVSKDTELQKERSNL